MTNVTRRDLLLAASSSGVAALIAGSAKEAVATTGLGITADQRRLVDTRAGAGPLASGTDHTFGPFAPGGATGSSTRSVIGMIGIVTATEWTGAGWISIRPGGNSYLTAYLIANLNFSGPLDALSNTFLVQFGAPAAGSGDVSNGQITVHIGPDSGAFTTHLIIDVMAWLN